MALWFALVLGLVQGAAEFLPVSSSGHLALIQAFFPGLAPEDGIFFDVVLHLATLISLTIVYRRELWGLGKALASLPFRRGERNEDRRLLGLLALGTLPLGLVLPLKGWLEARSGDPRFIGAALLCNGALLYISDKLISGLLKRAEGRGLSFVTLEVRAGNLPAISLYEKHGFAKVGLRKKYYSYPVEDAILMTKYMNEETGE